MSSFFSRSRGKKTSASLEGIKEGQALETKKKETPPPAESMKGGFTRYDIISTPLCVLLSCLENPCVSLVGRRVCRT